MPSVAVIVWSWQHEGRHEALFLELGDSYRIHFLRRTRSRRLAWGSCGTWALLMDCITIRLQLRNFRCCEGARIRQVEFLVDPVDPHFMVDGTGRRIRYLGVMHMSIFQHDPRRALSLTGDVCDVIRPAAAGFVDSPGGGQRAGLHFKPSGWSTACAVR